MVTAILEALISSFRTKNQTISRGSIFPLSLVTVSINTTPVSTSVSSSTASWLANPVCWLGLHSPSQFTKAKSACRLTRCHCSQYSIYFLNFSLILQILFHQNCYRILAGSYQSQTPYFYRFALSHQSRSSLLLF